ncbi:protein RL8A [Panine betaherpesvirus 2]|uniref:Protein RL8A n=1 Tax=Panine betaherpesvirus 2 TaxID=188763 RepID=G9VYW4_9BETA|nr:protein RL8A [Panine betaherpesvirus 2]AEV81010.1 protein RL8A [Panine betaherpesvirus 2]QXV67750.1 protein RL8A [Panine betaherpesvirus 2]
MPHSHLPQIVSFCAWPRQGLLLFLGLLVLFLNYHNQIAVAERRRTGRRIPFVDPLPPESEWYDDDSDDEDDDGDGDSVGIGVVFG